MPVAFDMLSMKGNAMLQHATGFRQSHLTVQWQKLESCPCRVNSSPHWQPREYHEQMAACRVSSHVRWLRSVCVQSNTC